MMKLYSLWLAAGAALMTMCDAVAAPQTLQGFTTVLPVVRAVSLPAGVRATTVTPLPSWKYNVTASADLGGGKYSGISLGSSPFAATPASTTLKVQIVPLVITINDGSSTVVYNPLAGDPCNGGNKALDVVKASPIFTKTTAWTMNGVSVGTTQHIDAFQRAEYWSKVGGSAYHVLLKPVALGKVAMSFSGSANGANLNATSYGGCGHIGIVNISDLDSRIQALITGPLVSTINAGTFPIFITKDVVSSEDGVSLDGCCVLGYHSGLSVGGNLQIYSPFSFDSSGLFGADVTTLSHEMAEAVNDPNGRNSTPTWGDIGQVPGNCQSNFEVGDPLSEGWSSPTTPFTVKAANGLTYHMQELAFYSWFFGGASLGAGGKFSDNGTFGGDAKRCSAGGGTN